MRRAMALTKLRPLSTLLNGTARRGMLTGPNVEAIQKGYCAYWKQKSKWSLVIVPAMMLWQVLFLPPERELYEYRPFSHLRVHEKDFAWGGKKTLFHHPVRNPVPGIGYEVPFDHPYIPIEDF
ncbi:hypothetical protein KUTeg_017672 [Tegillarca granosa]|uniref:Uncharacterized protein n=1 Tax=Tegillarca granosa TaxID=220873 RepID=A0ABQ9EFL3_TEGGR|nr:hypothetical protein KUTeg_017672 [Tegillarca granosa]